MTPQQRTLLVVNEDPQICELFTGLFQQAGFRVVTASSASEAARVLAEQRPDVALVDMALPEQGGFAVLQAVKRVAGAATPVVMIAGHAEEADRQKAAELGADELLVSPWVDDLLASVAKLCPPRAT